MENTTTFESVISFEGPEKVGAYSFYVILF